MSPNLFHSPIYLHHSNPKKIPYRINLPPTTLARPLPTSKSSAANGIFTTDLNPSRPSKKRKRAKDTDDDTPKAFQRLMAFSRGQKLPKGLDDGIRPPKAKKSVAKKGDDESGTGVQITKKKQKEAEKQIVEIPTIKPGEKMSEFSARVDAALPVSGLINKGAKNGKDPLGLKVGRTKTEKRMHRMYDEWRAEEARIKEKREEAAELAEEEEMEEDENGQVRWKRDLDGEEGAQGKKAKKGGKKKKVIGEIDDGEEDPWAVIKRNRNEGKVGLNDVVKAPPTFSKVPKEKFKVRAGARVEVEDVPKASGSLRRREELGVVRKSVVEGYRQMMKDSKKAVGVDA